MAAVGPAGGNAGGGDGPVPWYIAQLQMLVKTVGVSGVFLGVILWGLYSMANKVIDVMQPQINSFVAKQIQFIGSIEESNRKQTVDAEQKTAILTKLADVVQSTDGKIERVNDRLGKIEAAVGSAKNERSNP